MIAVSGNGSHGQLFRLFHTRLVWWMTNHVLASLKDLESFFAIVTGLPISVAKGKWISFRLAMKALRWRMA